MMGIVVVALQQNTWLMTLIGFVFLLQFAICKGGKQPHHILHFNLANEFLCYQINYVNPQTHFIHSNFDGKKLIIQLIINWLAEKPNIHPEFVKKWFGMIIN